MHGLPFVLVVRVSQTGGKLFVALPVLTKAKIEPEIISPYLLDIKLTRYCYKNEKCP